MRTLNQITTKASGFSFPRTQRSITLLLHPGCALHNHVPLLSYVCIECEEESGKCAFEEAMPSSEELDSVPRLPLYDWTVSWVANQYAATRYSLCCCFAAGMKKKRKEISQAFNPVMQKQCMSKAMDDKETPICLSVTQRAVIILWDLTFVIQMMHINHPKPDQ